MAGNKFPKPTSPGEGIRHTFDEPIALGSEGVPYGFVPTADGVGGAEWKPGGGGGAFFTVQDKDVTDPSTLTPSTGQSWIVAAGAVGAWSGQDENIATWNGASWNFTVPTSGKIAYVVDESEEYIYDGANWVLYETTITHNDTKDRNVADCHPASSITNDSGVAGAEVKAALDTLDSVKADKVASSITYPSLTFNGVHYDSLCCAMSYGGNDYHYVEVGGIWYAKHCGFADLAGDFVNIGAPSAVAFTEPQTVFDTGDLDVDGTSDIDALLLLQADGIHRGTVLCDTDNTAGLVAVLPTMGITIDLVIASVFTANGAGIDYTFNLAAITGAGATLWGGDGADGERTVGPTAGNLAGLDGSGNLTDSGSKAADFEPADPAIMKEGEDVSLLNNDADYQSGAQVDGKITTHKSDADAHHSELHSIASHNDTTATGAELETLTDGSNADALHTHAASGLTNDSTVPGASIKDALESLSSGAHQGDSGTEAFVAEWEKAVIFTTPFTSAPDVVAVSSENVNVFVTDVTAAGCKLKTSAVITGDVSWIATTVGAAVLSYNRTMQFAYSKDKAQPYIEGDSDSWQAIGEIIFSGSSYIGIPAKVTVIISNKDVGKGCDWQILDLTNASNVIASGGNNNIGPNPILDNDNAPANISAAAAIWELQIKRNPTGGSDGPRISALEVAFDA